MSIIDRKESIHAGFSRLRQFARHSVGRITGTVPSTNGRYKLLRDLAESRHFHRVELNAVINLLVKKGMFTKAEFDTEIDEQIAHYEKAVGEEWPEVKPAADGRSYSLDAQRFSQRIEEEDWPQ